MKDLEKELEYQKRFNEMLLNMFSFPDDYIESIKREARKKVENKVMLTKNQKENLEITIQRFRSLTGHNYDRISFHKEPVEHTRLWYEKQTSFDIDTGYYDSISGKFVSWQDFGKAKFADGKKYLIKELLGEMEDDTDEYDSLVF